MASNGGRVLIVGAGPTGLTAAVELARRGILPDVVDAGEGPTQLSKAVGISPRSLDLLEPSGVTERLLARGIRIRRGCVHRRGKVAAGLDFTLLQHRFAFLLSLPQAETETAMAEALSAHGGIVQWSTALTGVARAGDALQVALAGPQGRREEVYDCVFGADGARSTVRESAGIAFSGYEHERRWSIADAEISDWPYPPATANLFLHEDGDVGFVIPIGEHRYRAVSNTANALARIPGRYRVRRRLREDVFSIPVRQAQRYQSGGIFLGGDAAHVHSPVGARGMNLGIEDAACFARRFAVDQLEGYTAERRPVAGRWIGVSERILATVQSTRPVVVRLRSLALGAVSRSRWLQRRALERVAGVEE